MCLLCMFNSIPVTWSHQYILSLHFTSWRILWLQTTAKYNSNSECSPLISKNAIIYYCKHYTIELSFPGLVSWCFDFFEQIHIKQPDKKPALFSFCFQNPKSLLEKFSKPQKKNNLGCCDIAALREINCTYGTVTSQKRAERGGDGSCQWPHFKRIAK